MAVRGHYREGRTQLSCRVVLGVGTVEGERVQIAQDISDASIYIEFPDRVKNVAIEYRIREMIKDAFTLIKERDAENIYLFADEEREGDPNDSGCNES